MKTFLFCLLILSHASIGNRTINHSKPGGVNVLKIDPAASTIGWKAEKTTGTHTGTIKIRSGSLTFYCRQLAKGTVLIDMNTINVADLQPPRKQQLESNLKGDNFFDTDKFPLAQLDIVSVNSQSEASYHFVTITGNLQMHGVTQKIVFTANISKNTADNFVARADILINRQAWDIATRNMKYNLLINKFIRLDVLLQANKVNEQVSSL